jgi:hypothetical protein
MQAPAQDVLILGNANLIDGLSDQVILRASVLIQGDRILSVSAAPVEPPANAAVIDATDSWLLPGLIDAHVHLTDLKGGRAMVAASVTTVRTMSANHFVDVGIRELHRIGAKDLPDVMASGYQLPPDMKVFESCFLVLRSSRTITPPPNTAVSKYIGWYVNVQRGVNQIKILATERGGTPDTDPRRSGR